MRKPKIIHKSEKQSRVLEITLQGKTLSTPTYFPAISSYGIKFSLRDLLYLLKHHKYPRVLVSAYDLHNYEEGERKKLLSTLKSYRRTGFLYVDSGIYESSWKGDQTWDINSYKSLISQIEFDLYSCFDILPYKTVGKTDKEFKKNTFNNIIESSVFLNNVAFIAILHGSSPGKLIGLVKEFVEKYPHLCGSTAIPERDCGKSILERARTILEIRRILNDNDCRNLLHVLGCGNPLSMLLFSYCGADIFDSLDWLKFVINPDNLSINHFSHLELLNCKCCVCTESPYKDADYLEKALLHNLLFYQNFVIQTQSLIRDDNLQSYLRIRIDKKIMDQIDKF